MQNKTEKQILKMFKKNELIEIICSSDKKIKNTINLKLLSYTLDRMERLEDGIVQSDSADIPYKALAEFERYSDIFDRLCKTI